MTIPKKNLRISIRGSLAAEFAAPKRHGFNTAAPADVGEQAAKFLTD